MNYQGRAYALDNKERVNTLLSTAFCLYWLIIVPVWLLCIGLTFLLPIPDLLLYNPSSEIIAVFNRSLFVFMTITLFTIPLTVFPATLSGLRDLHVRQLYELFLPFLMLLIVFITLYLGGKIFAIIVATGLVQIVFGIGSYLILRIRHPFVKLSLRNWDPKLMPSLISNSAFFFLMSITLIVQRSSGNILVGHFTEIVNVSQIFPILLIFRVIGWSVIDLLSRPMQPYIILFGVSNDKKDKLTFLMKLSVKISFSLALIFAAEVWIFGKDFLRLWLGANIFIGYVPLIFLTGSFLVDIFFLPMCNFLVALNRHKRIASVMLIYSVLTLFGGILGAICEQKDPLLGICIGFFVASFLGQGVIMSIVCAFELEIKIIKFFKEFIAKSLLLLIGAMIVMYLFFLIGPSEIWKNIFYGMFVIIIIYTISWVFVIDRDERKWINNKYKEILRPLSSH
jgi:O-antigen/teichoic acid export membrane protein